MTNTTTAKTLEKLVAAQTPKLQQTDPQRLRDLQALLAEVKRAKSGPLSVTSQKTLRSLFVWQLELKRAAYVKRLERLEQSRAQDAATLKRATALKNVITVLDEAKKAMSTNALQPLERAAKEARESLAELQPAAKPAVKNLGPTPAARPAQAKPPTRRSSSEYAAPTWLAAKLEVKAAKK